ncbi:hypothetical protein SKAU_G00390140 [Synaphobranchus kaupii]|uniref:Uncharacterized protein n=1 Tax=Synaphobranchus kaupii TaxID=118154 RepID=A0A9Q1IDJ0_SYNKA|nr:hypothetical protein SKAU_G00390140 [Synaphobranchus kaupii]
MERLAPQRGALGPPRPQRSASSFCDAQTRPPSPARPHSSVAQRPSGLRVRPFTRFNGAYTPLRQRPPRLDCPVYVKAKAPYSPLRKPGIMQVCSFYIPACPSLRSKSLNPPAPANAEPKSTPLVRKQGLPCNQSHAFSHTSGKENINNVGGLSSV